MVDLECFVDDKRVEWITVRDRSMMLMSSQFKSRQLLCEVREIWISRSDLRSSAEVIAKALNGTVCHEERKRKKEDEGSQDIYPRRNLFTYCDEAFHHCESVLGIHSRGEYLVPLA